MAATLELSAKLAQIINAQVVPAIAIDKLREIKAADVADFATLVLTRMLERIAVGLAAHARDLGDSFNFPSWETSAMKSLSALKCASGEFGRNARLRLTLPSPLALVVVNPTVNSITH